MNFVHQTQTQKGAKSRDVVLERSSLIICSRHSLYMSFMNNGMLIINEHVEAPIPDHDPVGNL